MMQWFRGFVGLTEQQALVVSLWALHTWCYERFTSTPYLEITATTKRSGKTTLMEAIALVSRQSQLFATVRMLTVVRLIEALEGRLTLGFDEAERLSSAALGDTRSMLAVGYRKGQMHAVASGSKIQKFATFCPKMFSLIGNLTGVLRDRSIPIEMMRSKPVRDFQADRPSAEAEAAALVDEWQRIAARLDRIPVVAPEWLDGRERELWTPLVSLAAALGLHKQTQDMLIAASVDFGVLKTLPAKQWHSAQDETDAEERDAASRCLADLRSIVAADERAIPSAVAVERLRGITTAPWRAYKGVGLNENTLAALLSRYGIAPGVVSIGKGRKGRKQYRGYTVADILKPVE